MKATLVDPRAREVSKQMLRVLAKQGKSDTQSEIELALNAHAQEWFTDPPNEAVSALLSQPDALIIGLHPDQATEPIVDIGLRQNIPWAIVPCCVFPQLYPDRIWPGEEGGQVNSTEKLIDWLKTKDPGIREAYLPFEGRNRVLYWFGREAVNQDTLHSTPSIQNEVI
ncbi:hypothetical protein BC830DRAFT_1154319 [Chytriomyces sp. MP71]|nr:hypothetical protein BC830DRAFT_1154319 [Chytriomyces sp. MP71]